MQTERFNKEFNKIIPQYLKLEFTKQISKLTENPYNSKPLKYKFLREKKIKKWRIYFSIYDDLLIIYFIGLSDKKTQQEKINEILKNLDLFKEEINKNKIT